VDNGANPPNKRPASRSGSVPRPAAAIDPRVEQVAGAEQADPGGPRPNGNGSKPARRQAQPMKRPASAQRVAPADGIITVDPPAEPAVAAPVVVVAPTTPVLLPPIRTTEAPRPAEPARPAGPIAEPTRPVVHKVSDPSGAIARFDFVPAPIPALDVPLDPEPTAEDALVHSRVRTAVTFQRRSTRPRVRRVTRVVRHVDTWSIFKVALVFNVFLYAVALTAGVLLWHVAVATGTIDNVQKFFEGFGWTSFQFKGGEIYHNAWIAGLFVAVGLTGLAVLMATLFNLITDLVGGIRVSVLEEEVLARRDRTPVATAADPASPYDQANLG
jgi:hypothetical protein